MIKDKNQFKLFSLSVVWLWLLLFALIPFVLIIIASLLSHSETHLVQRPFSLEAYQHLFTSIYLRIFGKSFLLAAFCTLLCLIFGYPFAYLLAKQSERIKNFLMLLVIIPFWTSSLIRSYAMIAILKAHGILNTLLIKLGIIHQPLQILFTDTAVLIGLVYNLLPFMILPLFANIERLDVNLVDAARDLGASWFTTFRKVIIPLTMPGILAGSILVLLPAMTLFYIPDLLGGAKSMLLGNLIQDQFLFANNWPEGSAISIALTVVMALLLIIYWRNTKAHDRKDLL